VRPGEHFWSIAAAHLSAAWGTKPELRQVGRYWRALVAANRDRLADPANPDLLFPGQRLRLPPVPDPGARR
jgi:nucleoid-associated protein YgaU